MKQHIKKLSVLLLLIIATIFSSCETEKDYITSENSNQKYQLKEISFAEFKTNQAAFQKLKEAHSKKNSTLKQKGVYNEDYGVFIDTTNIILVQKENKHSITFQIADEEVINKIQNLVLTSKDDGGYTAYIAEYLLNQQEIQSLKEGEKLENKYPSTITKIDNNSTVNVSESNSGCVYSYYVTRYYCRNAADETIRTSGDLGDGCVGTSWKITTLIIDIDLGCGGSNPGSGYSGGGLNGGGTNTAGSSGSSNNGNTGNPSNGSGNNSGHDDPVFTTPVLDINAFKEFVLGLTDQQRDWLNNPLNSNIKLTLENYINQSPNKEVAKNFADELIEAAIDYLALYGNNPTSHLFLEEFFNDIFTYEEIDVEDVEVTPPSCESFNFASTGTNWQMAAVANIRFQITVLTPQGAYVSHVIDFPQPMLFEAPKNLSVGNTVVTPGMAASASATALMTSIKETVKKYGNKPVSELVVRLYFEQRLKHNYPLYMPGGRVKIHPTTLPVTPTQYQTNAFGIGNCN